MPIPFQAPCVVVSMPLNATALIADGQFSFADCVGLLEPVPVDGGFVVAGGFDAEPLEPVPDPDAELVELELEPALDPEFEAIEVPPFPKKTALTTEFG